MMFSASWKKPTFDVDRFVLNFKFRYLYVIGVVVLFVLVT